MSGKQEKVDGVLKTANKINNLEYVAGSIQQKIKKSLTENSKNGDDLETIYYLVESHAPSFHMRAALRYDKNHSINQNQQKSLSKDNIGFDVNLDSNIGIEKLLERLKEMPKEWTLVQLTPHFNASENIELEDKHYTNYLHLTVFNCGGNQPKPFLVKVEPPRCGVTGAVIPFIEHMHTIMKENLRILESSNHRFRNAIQKDYYFNQRHSIDDSLKMVVKELQDLYLKEFRCFLLGKFIKDGLEQKIIDRIKEFFKLELPTFSLTEKTISMLLYVIKGVHFLKPTELKRAIQFLMPNKAYQKQLMRFVKDVSDEFALFEQKRHPVILILDDSLDCLPWEMIEVFNEVSVSRVPSFHLVYALYKEHKDSIINGHKILQDPSNGKFIINPDLNLQRMENRISSFYKYWLPKWEGVTGSKPTEEEFEKLLCTSEIFAFSGHGSGSQFYSLQKIEKLKTHAVVLLFGCSSTRLKKLGPQIEMFSAYQMYFIACCPCVVGNLWEVTDLDSDILASNFLSQWIPNSEKTHWKNLDTSKWKTGDKVDFKSDKSSISNAHHPELLKALNAAKRTRDTKFYITNCALVARGIPVKISP